MVRTVLVAGVGNKAVCRALNQVVDVEVADIVVGIQLGNLADLRRDPLGNLFAERLIRRFIRRGRLLGLLGIIGGHLPCRFVPEEDVAENDGKLEGDDHGENHKEDRQPN